MPVQTAYNEFRFNQDEEEEDEEEEVPETQEEEEDVEVIPAPTKTKAKTRLWTQDEEVALAKAFIGISEDPVKGNHQKTRSFWKKVYAEFNEHLGRDSGRNHEQVRSKWKDMNGKVTSFAGIYNKRKSNMSSGMNDEDVLKASQKEYCQKHNVKGGFPHCSAWEVMRNFPKWSGVITFEEMEDSSSKRAKTSSSNARSFEAEFMPIDLNDEECTREEPEPPARPTEPPRKHRKKPVQTTSTNSEDLARMLSEFNAYNKEEVEDKKRARAEKLRLKEMESEARIARDQKVSRFIEEQQKQNDLEFMLKPHDEYTGATLEMVLARKQEIAARWGWSF